MSNQYAADIVIVGGGVMGLAAAYYAAQEGQKVLVLEQDTFNSRFNSSYGESRMYRLMYSDPYLAELAVPALDLWNALETEYMGASQMEEKKLLSRNGLLFYGEWSNEETIEGSLGGAATVMEQRGIPFEHLDSQGLATRFPVFKNMPPKFEGLFEGGSGFVYADRACQAFRERAQQDGVLFQTGVRVERVQASANAVSIFSEAGETFIGQRAILCPGAWVNNLLEPSFGIRLDVKLWHMDWAHYRIDSTWENDYPQWFCFSRMPSGENDPADQGLYYGFPCIQDGLRRIKVGVDWTDRICTSMDEFNYTPSEATLAKLDRFVRTQFKGIGERIEVACAPYTMSPDVRFVLDTIPNHPNVALFTAGSGQAFKFAPLIGKLLVELVYTGQTNLDIKPLNISRLLTAL